MVLSTLYVYEYKNNRLLVATRNIHDTHFISQVLYSV